MVRLISLGLFLFFFWLLLSGHYTPFLIVIGAVSAAGVVWLAHRMEIVDAEGHPIHLLGRAVTYTPWLIREIVTSALRVTRIVLDPTLPISPTLVRVKASQKTPLGVNMFANSITLTPGTISIKLDGQAILVHAIEREGADSLEEGTMDRRVCRFEGRAGGAS